jgi:hypothetical protein
VLSRLEAAPGGVFEQAPRARDRGRYQMAVDAGQGRAEIEVVLDDLAADARHMALYRFGNTAAVLLFSSDWASFAPSTS